MVQRRSENPVLRALKHGVLMLVGGLAVGVGMSVSAKLQADRPVPLVGIEANREIARLGNRVEELEGQYSVTELKLERLGRVSSYSAAYRIPADLAAMIYDAALAEGLERLPPREVEYRGVQLQEFDLDAALARKPGLLLLDELAHTNAPGGRHAKRWQDVEELLDAGVDIHTTLNVQHVESLSDLVHRVTGVEVRETVPDRLLDAADEVEFVDLPPEALLKRLAEGKVYVPDRAAQAVRHFFRRGNLLALRELALRRTAEHVDADVQDYRRDHEIDRVEDAGAASAMGERQGEERFVLEWVGDRGHRCAARARMGEGFHGARARILAT